MSNIDRKRVKNLEYIKSKLNKNDPQYAEKKAYLERWSEHMLRAAHDPEYAKITIKHLDSYLKTRKISPNYRRILNSFRASCVRVVKKHEAKYD